jgi:hypothetical protein
LEESHIHVFRHEGWALRTIKFEAGGIQIEGRMDVFSCLKLEMCVVKSDVGFDVEVVRQAH